MNKIYEHGRFIILEGTDQYIVVNKTKEFKEGHTHISNYNTALWLIKLSEHMSMPHSISLYLLESLIRINTDEVYIRKLKELQFAKQSKRKDYFYNKGDFKYGKKRKGIKRS